MPKEHNAFHSSYGKRLILVVDDEMINREILGTYLNDTYEVLYAFDGAEALEKMREYRNTLSLVLLDILMPVMSGLDVLKAAKADPLLARIPIIVITTEQEAEVQSLKLGAIDFIPKPYPAVDVVLARVLRTIELSEDRDIIQSTERDTLTGLYNKEYFFKYAKQYDQFHPDLDTDAVIIDVNHFHMINERYGKVYGDEVLKRIGDKVRTMVHDSGGIVCRREADTFMIYCPHREDYPELLENASNGLAEDTASNRIRLRMGIYPNADKSIDIERRFDRAKMAADSVQGNFNQNIGVYNDTLHNKELYAEQLIEDFPTALEEHQFQVYYQPKFDIRPDTPLLSSAEALVRWVHPKLGMINPGVFIPLFEDNGLIKQLDTYVWNETARQIREWKEHYGYHVPISVNVSRIDMYDTNILGNLQSILEANGLTTKDLLLEVTESAYTQDSEQIIETARQLQQFGFQIEMDDFGTGYSSLNMISQLPIDVLKLDMQFIRDAFREGGNTHMVEVIIDIADFLSVPVIAEGVETEEQLGSLKALGCDIVQGYFFSRPVPAAEFEPFILQRKEALKTDIPSQTQKDPDVDQELRASLQQSLEAADKDAFIDSHTGRVLKTPIGPPDQPVPDLAKTADQDSPARPGLQLRTANFFFVVLAFIAALALFVADLAVTRGYQRVEYASSRYIAAQRAASNMESVSDYLTDRVRCFVVTGELHYLLDFFEEVDVARRRDKALEDLEALLKGNDSDALRSLNNALSLSNELVETEYLAMRLAVDAGNYDKSLIPDRISQLDVDPKYQGMSPEALRNEAELLVFDNNYMHHKDSIRENVSLCTQALIQSSSHELDQASALMSVVVQTQTIMTVVLLLMVLAIVLIISTQIRKPLSRMVALMQAQESIPPTGVEELRFVTRTYNSILQENKIAREKLSHEASHDPLTGLLNRGAYELLLGSVDTAHMALILVDVDYFKTVNDTYGHAVGDKVLKRVAEILLHSFRSVDIVCRIGGDEFIVIMTRANSTMKQLVINKINMANETLMHPKDGLPPISLSVGAAFSDRPNPQGDIFMDADTALYRAKEKGKSCCVVYE